MKTRERSAVSRAGLAAVTTLSLAACAGEPLTGAAEQAAISPLPTNLNLVLNARTSLTVSSAAHVAGDVASSGPTGSVLFDVGAVQDYSYYSGNNVLANSVHVLVGASVGHVYGNDLVIEGTASYRSLGLDPSALPQVPSAAAADPSNTKVTVDSGHVTQLCPGRYGTVSIAPNATLNLNGGVYHINKLILADSAHLEPSEPVVIIVARDLTTGTGAFIRPYSQLVTPMSAGDIRIEVSGDATIGPSSEVRAHLLVPRGQLSTGSSAKLYGAGWADTISIGIDSHIYGQGTFDPSTPEVPPPCNDNSVCTTDSCVGGGTPSGFCRNTPVPVGTSCEDGVYCNGEETCNSAGHCQAGTPLPSGTSCSDGDACNGEETCSGWGSCLQGTPPAVNDNNSCTVDSCDPATGVSHDPLEDGATCYGSGTCQSGACEIQGTYFLESFFQYQTPSAQCASWNSFRGKLTAASYSSVTISGSLDPLGVTCNEPAKATQLCQALNSGGAASVYCNGRTWSVGNCGYGTEITSDGSTCSCTYSVGHLVRPCGSYYNWGGAGTATCSYAPSQAMMVNCQ